MQSQKATPKSCSCGCCTRGKATKTGKYYMKREERAFRHDQKIALNKGQEDIGIAPHGDYND